MGVSFGITQHAAERFIERVAPAMSLDEARAEIRSHARAIDAAFAIGCKCVRLGSHARIILDLRFRQVVTVLPAPTKNEGIGCARRATRRRPEQGEE